MNPIAEVPAEAGTLPDELRYSPYGLWVRGTDRVHLGVVRPAFPEVRWTYQVYLPRARSPLKRGQPFAQLETDAGRVPLLAPFDGETRLANPQLGRTRRAVDDDPYGRGWLIQAVPSDPAQLDELMQAPAAMDFYQWFVQAGRPRGRVEQAWSPGTPWWDRLTVEMEGCEGPSVVACLRPLAPLPGWWADWVPGRRWRVRVRSPLGSVRPGHPPRLQTTLWEYRVDGLTPDGVAVSVTHPEGQVQVRYALLYEPRYRTLLAAREVTRRGIRNVTVPAPGQAFLESDLYRRIILDQPLLPTFPVSSVQDGGTSGRLALRQHTRFMPPTATDPARVEVRLWTPTGQPPVEVRFTLRRGAPWWMQVEKRLGDHLFFAGQLIDAP